MKCRADFPVCHTLFIAQRKLFSGGTFFGGVPRHAVTRELSDIFRPRIRLIQDEITAMDFTTHLLTGVKETYRYDYVVVTTGTLAHVCYLHIKPSGFQQGHQVPGSPLHEPSR